MAAMRRRASCMHTLTHEPRIVVTTVGAPDREGIHLGYRNVEAALAFLDRQGITVRSRDTGGARGRKLIYHTDTGDALVRLL